MTPTSDNGDVTIDNGDATVEPSSLTFTSANWDDPQTVTVRAAQDDDGADESATLTHAVTGYGDVSSADDVTVNVVDDDSAGVTVTPTALTVDEGESGTYAVVLNTDPDPGQDGRTVTVTPTSDNDDVTIVGFSSLTFTSANWDDPQSVTVRAAHDGDIADESATLTHEVTGYEGVSSAEDVTVNVVDDDDVSAGVTVTPTALTVDEGEFGTYTVVLKTDPDPEQVGRTATVYVTSNNAAKVFPIGLVSLTFTSANWDVLQTFSVFAQPDADAADESATLTHAVVGYKGVSSADDVTVNVVDDDIAGVTVALTALTVAEGESGTYEVVLNTDPDPGQDGRTVTVTPTSDNGDVTVEPSSLTFTSANWDDPQPVTVRAAQDDDGADESATLTHAVTGYEGVSSADDVTVNVVDDDVAGVTVTRTALTVAEGESGTYEVVLTTDPDPGQDGRTVTVTPVSDNADVTVEPSSLTFTSANWDVSQTVTVRAAQDDDGADESATLTYAVSGYGDVSSADDVTVNVVDDDSAGVTVTPTALTVDEGESGTYTVVLDTDPDPGRDGRTVTVTPVSDNADVTVEPSSLTFTSANWDDPQPFTVRAAQDDDGADESATLTHAVSGYGNVSSADDVTVSITDPATVPGPPRNLTAIPGDQQVSLNWTEPAIDGGSPIIRYDYQVDDRPWVSTGGTETSHVVSNLVNGTNYTFRVRAVNSVSEDSPSSESVSAADSATPTAGEEVKEAVTETVEAVTAATAANITSNIGTRFSATPSSGSVVVVGGRTLNLGAGSKSSELPVATGRDRDSLAKPGRIDETWSPGAGDLLRSSAFEIALNAADDGDEMGAGATQWTVWGRGDLQFFESQPERGATYQGDLRAGYLGIDARLGDRWLAGVAVSRTNAEADFDTGGEGAAESGSLEVALTGVHPYLRYVADSRSELWTILGAGQGEIENSSGGDMSRETSDMRMLMGAVGIRRSLDPFESLDLAYLSDVGFARVETDDGLEAIDGLTIDTWRVRMGVEAAHTAELESGAALTSFVEAAGRFDGGDEDEIGIEVSPGLYISDPGAGIGLEVRGRFLLLHSAENYEERGLSMTASLSPRPGGLGLSLSLSPRWGAPTGGAETLWRDDTLERLDSSAARHDSLSIDARLGYGLRSMHGLLTPFGEFGLRDEDSRRLRVGAQFTRQSTSLGNLSVELSGERRDSARDDTEHRVGVVGRLWF